MALTIRQAKPEDAFKWLDLVKASLGEDFPDTRIYSPEWIAAQFNPATGQDTWVADYGGRLEASITVLSPTADNVNPVLNLGRQLNRIESYENGAAFRLLDQISNLADQRGHWAVTRVRASDLAAQKLFEDAGYVCAGYQPAKHVVHGREGILFYVRLGRPEAVTRLPISDALPQVAELAGWVLARLGISTPLQIRDGATGYPLQAELDVHDATCDDFELWRMQAQITPLPGDISSGYNQGCSLMRMEPTSPPLAFLGQHDDRMVAGLAYYFDEDDRCLRIVNSFSCDELSLGALMRHAVEIAQSRFNATYLEADLPMTAPRLLKSAEQLGFIPVAYLPAFNLQGGRCADVVKVVKLNQLYSHEQHKFTPQAKGILNIVDRNFEDQKAGLAVIFLLRGLPFFNGMGDGELRKVARLFAQKLVRPSEVVCHRGDASQEAFVVMRGQLDVHLTAEGPPVGTIVNGQIFGEQAFLDGGPRTATIVAQQPTILLVMHRQSFNHLIQHEPHLGMIIMRNIALELSKKLRHANALLEGMRQLGGADPMH